MSCGRLITAKCTTGWSSWIEGELWLFPDGLLLVRTSLATTVAQEPSRTVPDETRGREFLDGEIDALVASHKRNLWIDADQIEGADIHVGTTTSRVNLHMRNGRKIKLLWPVSDRAEQPLGTALAAWKVETSTGQEVERLLAKVKVKGRAQGGGTLFSEPVIVVRGKHEGFLELLDQNRRPLRLRKSRRTA